MSKTVRVTALTAAAAFLLILMGMRIYRVNRDAEHIPVVSYNEGEYVALGDDYFWQEDEKNPGYEVMVASSRIVRYADFVSEYGESEDYLDEGYRPVYIIDLELSVRNTNSDDNIGKGIGLINTRIQTLTDSFQVNSELFALVRPDLGGTMGFRVRAGTQMTIHLPYTHSTVMDRYETEKDYISNEYYLLLSMYPVKKTIDLTPVYLTGHDK